ncbi:MAG TPA: response regulator [Flavisolibacter sp.]
MKKKLSIVLIEDDIDDVEILQEALENENVSYSISILKDGGAAEQFCETAKTLPDIIVMDFNLPRVHGRDVIKMIRANKRFDNIPILILSTSSSKEDIDFAYNAGADRYQVKPATVDGIKETISTIFELCNARVEPSK